jgi:hypothetical protein
MKKPEAVESLNVLRDALQFIQENEDVHLRDWAVDVSNDTRKLQWVEALTVAIENLKA